MAAFEGHVGVVRTLLENGADASVETELGTAAEIAKEQGHTERRYGGRDAPRAPTEEELRKK